MNHGFVVGLIKIGFETDRRSVRALIVDNLQMTSIDFHGTGPLDVCFSTIQGVTRRVKAVELEAQKLQPFSYFSFGSHELDDQI